jgi:hypothetical protein
MKQIDAVNRILRLTGHASVNAVTDGDPHANLAATTLESERKIVLSQPWGFNHKRMTLNRDETGRVPAPQTDNQLCILFQPERWTTTRFGGSGLGRPIYATQPDPASGRLYVWNHDTDDWHRHKLTVVACFDYPEYRLIPENFAQWIMYQAAHEFYFERKQATSSELVAAAIRARSRAINSLAPGTIDHATGFSLVLAGTVRA